MISTLDEDSLPYPGLSSVSDQNINEASPDSKKGDHAGPYDGSDAPLSPDLRNPRPKKNPVVVKGQDGDDAAWGSNFWVTLVDPQVCLSSKNREKSNFIHFASSRKHRFMPAPQREKSAGIHQ